MGLNLRVPMLCMSPEYSPRTLSGVVCHKYPRPAVARDTPNCSCHANGTRAQPIAACAGTKVFIYAECPHVAGPVPVARRVATGACPGMATLIDRLRPRPCD